MAEDDIESDYCEACGLMISISGVTTGNVKITHCMCHKGD